jgi:hypothetical protein
LNRLRARFSHSSRCGLLSHATPWLNLQQDETQNFHAHRR